MKLVLVNDCSASGHFGSALVTKTLRTLCLERGHQVLGTLSRTCDWKRHRGLLDQADLVIVNGEGCIHHGKRMDLLEIARFYPCALVNALYQDVPANKGIHQFKYVAVRESMSQSQVPRTSHLVPDLIFASGVRRPAVRGGICLTDSVNSGGDLSAVDHRFLQEFGSAESACTGRYHGACLALLWNMPFSCWPTNSHKTEGMLRDARASHLYFPDQTAALEGIQAFDSTEYVAFAQRSVARMMDDVLVS